MRIGLQSPRINGIGILMTPSQLVQQDLQSYMVNIDFAVQQGTAVSPSQLAAILQQEVNAVCNNWPDQCGDVGNVISAAVATYASALAAAQNKAYQGAINNTIALPLPPSYYSPIYTIQAPPNALDVAAPKQTNVIPTPFTNSLQPPVPMPPVSATNQGTFTGNQGNGAVPGPGFDLNQDVSIGSLNIPMWGLIAAGIGVLFLMKGN